MEKPADSTSDNQSLVVLFIVLALVTIIGLVAFVVFRSTEKDATNNSTQKTQTMTTTTQPTIDPNKEIELTHRTVTMETNFGSLHIEMLDKAAPKTTENFIRLADGGYYDGIRFHRIAKFPGFVIIQGGDPMENGMGGESVWGSEFEDEVYKKGTKDFVADGLYNDYDGRVATFKKGYIAMANSGPNTNGSQFFIMLDDTKLPPAYTIFGKIKESDFPVLDKIAADVEATSSTGDGKPDKEIKILSAKLD